MSLAQALPELVKGLPAAFVTLVIGSIAAGIAYRQYRIARAKFKLDLFEKGMRFSLRLGHSFLSFLTQTGSTVGTLRFFGKPVVDVNRFGTVVINGRVNAI